jgi:hypothetical protein
MDLTCFCGHSLSDHDPDLDWLCKRWRHGSDEWCYCLRFLPRPVTTTDTASITLNLGTVKVG